MSELNGPVDYSDSAQSWKSERAHYWQIFSQLCNIVTKRTVVRADVPHPLLTERIHPNIYNYTHKTWVPRHMSLLLIERYLSWQWNENINYLSSSSSKYPMDKNAVDNDHSHVAMLKYSPSRVSLQHYGLEQSLIIIFQNFCYSILLNSIISGRLLTLTCYCCEGDNTDITFATVTG